MTGWPRRRPSPQPRTHVSPAGAAALIRCPLQVAYRDDPQALVGVPWTPALCIGTAAHLVLERAGAGHLPTDEARAEAWEEAIRAQVVALEAKGTAAVLWVSRPADWPFYALKRARTLRLARRLASLRGEAGPTPAKTSAANPAVEFEVWREALDGRLKGRIDVVRRGPPKIIEDYKTGGLSDEETGEIRQEYLVQMALYAVLEHAHDGIWPDRAVLIPLTGPSADVAIDPAEAARTAEGVLAVLDEYRTAAAAGELESLGRPSAATCRWCPFAVHCAPFWAACSEEWLAEGITAMSGRVEHISAAGGLLTLTLESLAGSIRGLVTIRGLAPVQMPSGGLSQGDAAGVSDVRVQRGSEELWATPSTRVECAEPGPAF